MNYYLYMSSTDYHEEPHSIWKKDLVDEFNKQEEFKKDNVITFIDPIQYFSMNPCVVSMDIQNLDMSNIVVFYIEKLSIGTLMELSYCTLSKYSQKKLYLISNNKDVLEHPWIRNLVEHSDNNTPFSYVNLCNSPKDAVSKIVSDLNQITNHINQ